MYINQLGTVDNINKIPFRSKNNSVKYAGLQQPRQDEFVSSNRENNKKNKTALFIAAATGIAAISLAAFLANKKRVDNLGVTPFMREIASSLANVTGEKVEPKSLKSIINGQELKQELMQLKQENFVASEENVKNGTFLADLHSHSLYSDGQGTVSSILDEVARYADHVNKKTGKKFIFALTDHDTAEGSKSALKIIAKDPDKFKNVKFVTGSEVSFVIKSDKTTNPYETSELLIYGFNPFGKKVDSFFRGVQNKRKDKAVEYIKDLNDRFGYADFSIEEFDGHFGSGSRMMNHAWKVHHYGQTKNAIAGLANSQNRDKAELYNEIMSQTDGFNMALGHLRDKGLVPKSYGDDSNITKLCKEKYLPHDTPNGIDYAGENNFDDVMKTFAEGENFIAFAHPYYITERNSEAYNLVNELVGKSKGYLCGTESYHQAYQNVDLNEVKKFNNNIVPQNKLIELGGRDNHNVSWLDIAY